MRTSAIVAGIAAASLISTGTAFADGSAIVPSPTRAIAPGQYFTGLVNGTSGGGVIRMNCRTASRAGHPFPGQSVSVRQVWPISPTRTGGFTGNASTIAATLHYPTLSSAVRPGPPPIPLAVFAAYEQRVAIPTTLTLPCGGGGVIVYDPVQGGNTARADRQPVKFVPGA